MCGITGFYSHSKLSLKNDIIKMNSVISHRGPDTTGVWENKNFGIFMGHQRLSILDLSIAGQQPMKSKSERYILTYNGEIYNHLEIRKEIEEKNFNIIWKGNSDTETLIEAIDLWGIEKTLKKIVGMFAFGLWDQKENCLTLVRDRMGEKPLYFGWQGKNSNKAFIFASELKALKVHSNFEKEISRDALALQLQFNCIPAPYSIYKNIYKLLPGHYLQLKKTDLEKNLLPKSKSYWSLKETAILGLKNLKPINIQIIKDELEVILKNTIKQQMISDVPLGTFLSGGVDSSLVAALMQSQSSQPIKTFTVGFNEEIYNEAQDAKKVANFLGTDHTEIYISEKQALDVVPKLPKIYDEPFSDSSQIPTYLVSELAKQKVTVSLTGDGGDEIFCGYNRYVMSKKWWNKICLIPLPLRIFLADRIIAFNPDNWNYLSKIFMSSKNKNNLSHLMYKFSKVLRCKTLDGVYIKLVSHIDNPTKFVLDSNNVDTRLSNYSFELNQFDDQQKMMIFDGLTYLPDDILVKVDRASMASSLETRAPFLDHRVIEFSWQIDQSLKLRNGQGKWILRQILNKYLPKNLIERPKKGFGVPLDSWLRGSLRDWAENLLDQKKLQEQGYFNSKLIRDKWTEHLSNKRDWQHDLWNILMFQAWMDQK